MPSDDAALELLRGLLKGSTNSIENPEPNDDYENRSEAPPISGGGQSITPPPPGGGSGGGDGMDHWRQAVESRLNKIEDRVHDTAVDLGKLVTRVDHLPTKDWAVKALFVLLALIGALVTFQHQIQHFIGLSNAS